MDDVKTAIAQLASYPYSKEAYELNKLCCEYTTMQMYARNQQFAQQYYKENDSCMDLDLELFSEYSNATIENLNESIKDKIGEIAGKAKDAVLNIIKWFKNGIQSLLRKALGIDKQMEQLRNELTEEIQVHGSNGDEKLYLIKDEILNAVESSTKTLDKKIDAVQAQANRNTSDIENLDAEVDRNSRILDDMDPTGTQRNIVQDAERKLKELAQSLGIESITYKLKTDKGVYKNLRNNPYFHAVVNNFAHVKFADISQEMIELLQVIMISEPVTNMLHHLRLDICKQEEAMHGMAGSAADPEDAMRNIVDAVVSNFKNKIHEIYQVDIGRIETAKNKPDGYVYMNFTVDPKRSHAGDIHDHYAFNVDTVRDFAGNHIAEGDMSQEQGRALDEAIVQIGQMLAEALNYMSTYQKYCIEGYSILSRMASSSMINAYLKRADKVGARY